MPAWLSEAFHNNDYRMIQGQKGMRWNCTEGEGTLDPRGREFSVEFQNRKSGHNDYGLNCCNCLPVKVKAHPNMKSLFISSY